MSEQFVLNVRQIMDYPLKPAADPGDAILMQTGGLGGPYVFSTAYGVAQALGGPDGQVGIGVPLPGDAVGTGVLASHLVTPLGCTTGWNWYVNALGGISYLAPGPAGQWCFDGTNLSFNLAPGGSAGQEITSFSTPLLLDAATGAMSLADTLTVARDPTAALEVATKQYADALHTASVWSFNGRTGAVTLLLSDVTGAGGAPIASPAFTGTPTAPTPNLGDTSDRLATTAFVSDAIDDLLATHPFVFTFGGRTGDVVLNAADLTSAGGALLASPHFTGDPQAPTPAPGDNDTSIATTAFVHAAIIAAVVAVSSFNGRTGAVTLLLSDITGAGGAPIASPNFTGIPTAPGPAFNSNSSQIATTAFVVSKIAASIAGVASFNSRTGIVTLTLADILGAGGAPLNSPQFTGTPTAPTPPANDVSLRLATTEFVMDAIGVVTAHQVTSWNGRTGDVVLTLGDITNAGGAPITSPEFQGVPSTPYPPFNSDDSTIPNTQWVQDHLSFLLGNQVVRSFNSRTGDVNLVLNDITNAGGAPIDSPHFTGIPTAPTAPAWTNTTQIATTEFVLSQIEKTIPEQGPPGPAGPVGPPGPGFQFLASVPTASALPATGNQPGDVRIADDSGIGYVWEVPPGAWSAIGELRGPPGTLPVIDNNQVLGNISGFVAPPVGLSQAQLTALVNLFTPTLPGAVPASGGGTVNFLRADGTWAAALENIQIVLRLLGSTGTWTPAGVAGLTFRMVTVECYGGGGSGGVATATHGLCAAGGGGSGGYTRARLTAAQSGNSQPITIGAGGAASAAGQSTIFGPTGTPLVTANGGGPGDNFDGATLLGRGGVGAITGTLGAGIAGFRMPGAPGLAGFATATLGYAGLGGQLTGGAARSVASAATTVGGTAAANTGAGGNGSVTDGTTSPAGGGGAAGLIVVAEYYW